MFEKKEDAIYKRYYLGGMCIWKKQKSAKEMFLSVANEMNGHCADMQSILRKNTKKILAYVDAHYEPKKITKRKK